MQLDIEGCGSACTTAAFMLYVLLYKLQVSKTLVRSQMLLQQYI